MPLEGLQPLSPPPRPPTNHLSCPRKENEAYLGSRLFSLQACFIVKLRELRGPCAPTTMRCATTSHTHPGPPCIAFQCPRQNTQAADPDRPLTPAEWGRLEDEKAPTPPVEVDEEDLIGRRARENVHAFLREGTEPEPRRPAYSYEAALKEEQEEEEREKMRREREGGAKEGMRWAGDDARKDLSLQDNDDDDDSPPWSARLDSNANPEERFEEEGGREEEGGGDLCDDGSLATTGSEFGSSMTGEELEGKKSAGLRAWRWDGSDSNSSKRRGQQRRQR